MRLRDLKDVDWFETLKLALARGFFSSLMLVLLMTADSTQAVPAAAIASFIVMWTFGGLIVIAGIVVGLLVFRWMGSLFGSNIPYLVMLLTVYYPAAIAFALGDWIIWLIIRFVPGVFNVEGFWPFNLTPFIIVKRGGPATTDLGFALPRSWTSRRSMD